MRRRRGRRWPCLLQIAPLDVTCKKKSGGGGGEEVVPAALECNETDEISWVEFKMRVESEKSKMPSLSEFGEL